MRKVNQGFTVFEVLVAATILFFVIATMTQVYKSAAISNQKAESTIAINGLLPIVIKSVEYDIRRRASLSQSGLSGKGSALEVSYEWQAELLERRSPPPRYNPIDGTEIIEPAKFGLWSVNITLEFKGKKQIEQFEVVTF